MILIGVIPENVDARRLYERRGMKPVFVYLLGTVKDRDAP
jgi:hypothetical protein